MEFFRPGTKYDFPRSWPIFKIVSICLVAISIVLFIFVGPNYGIDFKGGTNIIVRFTQPVSVSAVSATMRELGFSDAVVQQYGRADENQYLIETNRISVITSEQAAQIRQTLEGTFGSEGFLFSYDEDAGDRIEIKAPDTAFAHLSQAVDELDEEAVDAEAPIEAELEEWTGEGTGESAVQAADAEVPPVAVLEEGTGEGTGESAVQAAGAEVPVEAEIEEMAGDGTGEGTGAVEAVLPPVQRGPSELSPEELYITELLTDAGLTNPQVTQIGNPRHRRFLIRLQDIQGRVELGMREAFGVDSLPVENVLLTLAGAPDLPGIAEVVQGLGFEEPTVQPIEPLDANQVLVRASRTGLMTNQEAQQIESSLRESFSVEDSTINYGSVQRVESVGPRVGGQLRAQAGKALVLAIFFMLIYIGLRFNMRFAPGAVVAIFHDAMIVLGIFIVLREEVTLTVLAALLTIIGYSINDTIVVFDRIRENLSMVKHKPLEEVVNLSINETLSRTILTSLTTLFTVFAIYFIGAGSIKVFAFAMILGIVIGTYSSIYVASPLMITVSNWWDARQARQRAASGGVRHQAKRKRG